MALTGRVKTDFSRVHITPTVRRLIPEFDARVWILFCTMRKATLDGGFSHLSFLHFRTNHRFQEGKPVLYPAFSSSIGRVSECFFTISDVMASSFTFLLPGT